ncbi:MAG: hypothetical protein ACRDVP_02395 [Acidimicrobiales bacterium]
MAKGAVPGDAHEWVSFEDDDEERTWVFDVTFLTSRWTCIFGRGCKGVMTEDASSLNHGCCSYGAHFTDSKDLARVKKAAAQLTADQWQFRSRAAKSGFARTNRSGETVTRLVAGACIFLNRNGFPTGPGCALHQAALSSGARPLDLKPDVCWQLPLRRDDSVGDDGHVTSTIAQWDREHWGRGGEEFHWWCTESADAFVGKRAVYEEMGDELIEMVGPAPYKALKAYLDDRRRRLTARVPLPHPALRKR